MKNFKPKNTNVAVLNNNTWQKVYFLPFQILFKNALKIFLRGRDIANLIWKERIEIFRINQYYRTDFVITIEVAI